MTWKTLLFALLAVCMPTLAAAQDDILPQTEPVALDASNPDREEFGDLIYRGGVVIEPGEEKIGGLSGLDWHEDRLYAVSDDGRWFMIVPDEIGGKLSDIYSLSCGPLLDRRGKKLKRKSLADAEAIARTADGAWLVAFEQEHRVWRYEALDQTPTNSDAPFELVLGQGAPNAGIETLAIAGPEIWMCGEWVEFEKANCLQNIGNEYVYIELDPKVGTHSPVPTDADCGSDGTCYFLFRDYTEGVGNHIAIQAIPPGEAVKTLATFDPSLNIDNFEGLAVREQNGKTFLYLVSDNNFSKDQQTLLMKFEVRGAPPAPIAARTEPVAEPQPVTDYATVDIVLETTLGDITVRLETERAPITAANFLRYVDEARFDGTVFYRAMRTEWDPQPNGLIQGGTQWDRDRVLPGIPHEPTNETGLSHTRGALSMAMGEPGTANGDFSIMVQDQTGLDAKPESDDPVWKNGYAVFGYVIEGMAVVEAIHAQQTDPDAGEGWMKGQMLAEPIVITDARRAQAAAP